MTDVTWDLGRDETDDRMTHARVLQPPVPAPRVVRLSPLGRSQQRQRLAGHLPEPHGRRRRRRATTAPPAAATHAAAAAPSTKPHAATAAPPAKQNCQPHQEMELGVRVSRPAAASAAEALTCRRTGQPACQVGPDETHSGVEASHA